MTANVKRPKAKGSGSDEPFDWPSSLVDDDDQPIVITVPSLAVMPKPNQFELLDIQDTRGPAAATNFILKNGLEPDLLALIRTLPGQESEDFMRAWVKWSGVSLGESRVS